MKILEFKATPGFGVYKKLFCKSSVSHPAKINLNLLKFLITEYTKEGDLVLDPMAGTGSTGVMAVLHNRNAITVELEERFVEWSKKNIDRAEKGTLGQGKAISIQGDSRKLAELMLEHADCVVTSPPYGQTINNDTNSKKRMERLKKKGHLKEKDWQSPKDINTPGRSAMFSGNKYSDNPSNIGNLPLEVDTVITSPPFSDVVTKVGEGPNVPEFMKWAKEKAGKWPIPNEEFRKLSNEWQRKNKGYSPAAENIGNLPLKVDVAITSPPYGNRLSDSKVEDDDEQRMSYRQSGAANSKNIGNLPHADAIISSPPYEDQEPSIAKSKFKDPEKFAAAAAKRYEDGTRKGHPASKEAIIAQMEREQDGLELSGDNIGKLKSTDKEYKEAVDTVITSPPYGEGTGHGGGEDTKLLKEKELHLHGKGSYSESKDNIGEMRKETYLQAMKTVYSEMHKVLKPNGKAILVVKNFIRKKKVVPLSEHTIALMESAGFKLVDRLKFKLPTESFWRRLYKKKNPDVDTDDLSFEHILIFTKKLGGE